MSFVPRHLRRLAVPVLLMFALALSAFAPASAATTAGALTAVSVVASAKAERHLANSPLSQNAEFDGCIFCKSRSCSGHETLLTSQGVDPVILAKPRELEEPRREAVPPPLPGPAVPLAAFPASFNPRGPPFLG